MKQSRTHRRTAATALALALGLTATACGSSDDADADLPSIESQDDADGGDDGGDDDALADDAEQALLALSQCMRDDGFAAFPDPLIDSEGNASINRAGMTDAGIDPRSSEFRSAMDGCSSLLEGTTLGGGPLGGDRAESEDMLIELAVCMRREGISDFPDPDLSGDGGSGSGGPFGGALELESPAVEAAFEVCQTEVNLPNLGGGPGGGAER